MVMIFWLMVYLAAGIGIVVQDHERGTRIDGALIAAWLVVALFWPIVLPIYLYSMWREKRARVRSRLIEGGAVNRFTP
jgi:hypothetical protein